MVQTLVATQRVLAGDAVTPGSIIVRGQGSTNLSITASLANATAASSVSFAGVHARGTLAAPIATVTGDYLTVLNGSGYGSDDALDVDGSASIVIRASGTIGAGNVPGAIFFQTKLSGVLVDRWSFNEDGHFVAATDNTYDIGASGAARPRTIYVGTSIDTSAANLVTDTTTGTIFGTSTAQKLAWWNGTPQVQQAVNSITNNVTSSGTTDTIDDITLASYAADSGIIQGDLFQLARKVKEIADALRLYGILG